MIDLTPEGVRQDPARVNLAIEALENASAACANALSTVVGLVGRALDDEEWDAVDEARALVERRRLATEEFLRALCGRP